MILKKVKTKIVAAILMFALAICAVFGAFFGNSTDTANATATGTSYSLGTGGSFTAANLASLMGKIMGSSTAKSYNELKAYMDKDTDHARKGSEIGAQVSLGGQVWNVAYASQTKGGDVIATLWLAASSTTLQWNNWYADRPTWDYPSSMYGTSYIRSYLTGSTYAHSSTAGSISNTSLVTLTKGTQNTTWQTFVTQYGKYITTPSEVAYQETEDAITQGLNSYNYPNDAYGIPARQNWYLDSSTGLYDYSLKAGYSEWQYDKLWLPSLTETGYNSNSTTTGNAGIWGLAPAARNNTANSWLRSGRSNSANFANYLSADGSYSLYNVTSSYAVRPALHLNLKSAASAAGLFVDKPTLSKSSTAFSASAQTFTISSVTNVTPTLPAGWTRSSATVTIPANTPVGTYNVSVNPNAGYGWSDGSVGALNLPIQITPATISSITWNPTATSFAYTGSQIVVGASATGVGNLPVVVTGDNVNVGTFTVTAVNANPNYVFASGLATTKTVTVTKQNISKVDWSVANNSGFEYDAQNHAPTASFTAANGQLYSLPVTLSKGGTAVTSAVDAGTYTATVAAGTYNTNFNLATASTVTFTVNPREVQIDWGAESFAYTGGNRDSAVTLGVASGLLGSDTLTLTATYKSGDRVNVSDTGFIMEAAISGTSSNYKLPSVKTHTYKITPLTVSGVTAAATGTYTYNGSILTPTVNLTGGNIVAGDTVNTFVSGGGIDAGTHNVTVIGIDNPNYLLDGTISTTFTINPREIGESDIKWSVSDGDAFTYNGANHAPEAYFVYNGVTYVLPTDLSEAYNASATDYTSHVLTGVFRNNFKLVDTDTANPTGFASSVSFTINKAKITADDVEWSFTEGFKFAPNSDPAASALFRYNNVAYVLTLSYKNESGATVTVGGDGSQWKTGGYTATVALGSGAEFDNFELDGVFTRTFKITESAAGTYTVIWEGFSAVVNYNGADQKSSAYIIVDGEKLDVTVSVEKWDGSAWVAATAAKDAGAYRFTATRTKYVLENDKVECRIDPRVISVDYTNLTGLTHGTIVNVTASTTDPVAKAEVDAGILNLAVSGSGHVAGTHVVSVEAQVENAQGVKVATDNYVISNATAVQTIGKKVLSISDIEWKLDFTYDGNIKIPEGNVKASALTTNDQAGGAYVIFEFVYAVDAGKYNVKVLGISNENYTYAGEVELEITELELTDIKWDGVQDGNSVTYNKQDQTPKAYIEVGGSKIYLDGTLEKYDPATSAWGEVAYAINAGDYRVTVAEIAQGTGNYFLAQTVCNFTVDKYEISDIYLTQNVFTYDGNTPAIEVYAIGANNERVIIGNAIVLNGLGTAVTSYPDAGTYVVQVQAGVLGSNSNYTVKSLVATTFVINPQLVNVSFEITGNSWSWKADVSTVPTVTVKSNVANAIEVRYGKLGADNTKPTSSNNGLSFSFNITGMTGDGIITAVAKSKNYQITGTNVKTFNVIPVDGEATATFSFDGDVWSDDNLELEYDATSGKTVAVSGDNDVEIKYYKDGVLLTNPVTTTAGLDAGTYLVTASCPTRQLSTNITATTRTFKILPKEVDFADVEWVIDGNKVAGNTVSYNGQIYSATLNLGELADDFEVYYTNGTYKNVGNVRTTATIVAKNSNYKAVGAVESYDWAIEGVAATVAWNDDGTVASISGDSTAATGGSFFEKSGTSYKVVYKRDGVVLNSAPTEAGDYTAEVVLALGNDGNVNVTASSFSFSIGGPVIDNPTGNESGFSWWWILLIVITVISVVVAICALIVASKKKVAVVDYDDEDGFYDDVTDEDLY